MQLVDKICDRYNCLILWRHYETVFMKKTRPFSITSFKLGIMQLEEQLLMAEMCESLLLLRRT